VTVRYLFLTANHKWIDRHLGLYPIIYKIIIMIEDTIQNDNKAENAILEAVRALTEMGVQLNEVTVPMKAADFLQQAGEGHDDARDRIQVQMNRMYYSFENVAYCRATKRRATICHIFKWLKYL
jgi:Asp-tRNA(Asn)/Glu-tRNA(Gln) amidotransferase A subunit family amidase